MNQNLLTYSGGIPTVTGTVTLFNSVTLFPPGGGFHLLGQQWLQYSLRTASDGGTATGTVTGSYSTDKGVSWVPFYTKSTTDADDDDAAVATDVVLDEVYVGGFRDIRFQYTNAVEVLTVFDVQMALAAETAGAVERSPVSITEGAVTSWLRASGATSDVNGVSSVPDVLSANPATQSTNANKPALGTSSNGLPILIFDGSNDQLQWPITAGNLNANTMGFAFWVKPTVTMTGTRQLIVLRSPLSSADVLELRIDGATLLASIFGPAAGFVGRYAFTGNVFSLDTWAFVSWEFDSAAATDVDRCCLFVNGTRRSTTVLTFGSPGPAMTGIRSATGSGYIGDYNGTLPFNGAFGPNLYALTAKQTGATEGLLTSAARAALMNFERPT